MSKLIVVSIVLIGLMSVAVARMPSVQEPQTISECLNALQEYDRQQTKAARDAGTRPDYRRISKSRAEMARKYAMRFKVKGVKGPDLMLLARLYQEAEQIDLALDAINKRLEENDLTQAQRAESLLAGVQTALASPVKDENVQRAENFAVQLDTMPDEFIKQRIRAHSRLGGYYSYADIDKKNLEHHNTILALVERLSAEERKAFSNEKGNAYQAIALVNANRGRPDKAIETLREAQAELAGPPFLKKQIGEAIERYSLIGKPGATIKGDFWINAAQETKQVDPRGRVTLIQFTAHWCGPCRKSYPTMLKFHRQFGKDGLDVMFATLLYGFFEDRQELKPEAEMEANRKYYIEQHKIPFRISVQNRPERAQGGEAAPGNGLNESNYIVGGIPQIVLLDKQGTVRSILIGWDPANEGRVTRLIEKLLKETGK